MRDNKSTITNLSKDKEVAAINKTEMLSTREKEDKTICNNNCSRLQTIDNDINKQENTLPNPDSKLNSITEQSIDNIKLELNSITHIKGFIITVATELFLPTSITRSISSINAKRNERVIAINILRDNKSIITNLSKDKEVTAINKTEMLTTRDKEVKTICNNNCGRLQAIDNDINKLENTLPKPDSKFNSITEQSIVNINLELNITTHRIVFIITIASALFLSFCLINASKQFSSESEGDKSHGSVLFK